MLQALKGQLADLRSKVDDPASFKEIYTFAFGYYKEETQKSIGKRETKSSTSQLSIHATVAVSRWNALKLETPWCPTGQETAISVWDLLLKSRFAQ